MLLMVITESSHLLSSLTFRWTVGALGSGTERLQFVGSEANESGHSCTILCQNLHAIYEQQEISALPFGHIYFGNMLQRTFQLLNDGPTPLTFNAQFHLPGDDSGLPPKTPYSVEPSNGN